MKSLALIQLLYESAKHHSQSHSHQSSLNQQDILEMEQTSSFKGRINKNYSPNVGEKYWDWIKSVDVTLGLLRSRPRDASTYRVPSKLRAIKHEAYTPQMVSIGPYHRDKPDLRAMDEFKWRYMLAFVDRVVKSDTENTQIKELDGESREHSPEILALHKCSTIVSELEEEARAWCKMTDMPKTNDDLHVHPQDQVPFVSLAGNFTMVQTLAHDLMLLENQIPYVILQQLFNIIQSSKQTSKDMFSDTSLSEYAIWFFNSAPMLHYKFLEITIPIDDTCTHLLDLLHDACFFSFKKLPSNYYHKNWGFKRCATELLQSGFKIICGNRLLIVDIGFDAGDISIPQVIVDKSSDTLFRNLIALEQTSFGRQAITSYVKLMSSLIRSPEDANLLERAGIIITSDEVEDASAFFKSLCREVVFVDFYFEALCDDVENYQIPLWRWRRVKGYFSIMWFRWKESIKDLEREYFRNKWSFIAFLAASFVIVLALVQTFYAVRTYYPPYH
ncbi:hypothetical protein POM88_048999 [Heracleum sosnowskyi]|uniref:Uncharacterized protein n=1 Tax=Heracleum sosnowskyi TaxID=360622 RepID=A0AAD8M187_9APIA|nr:hypothetical protein POM88_048999 [Heracleum sosnowskyi]